MTRTIPNERIRLPDKLHHALSGFGLDLPDGIERVLQLPEDAGSTHQQGHRADDSGHQGTGGLAGVLDHFGHSIRRLGT
jgi:hypothetical protein